MAAALQDVLGQSGGTVHVNRLADGGYLIAVKVLDKQLLQHTSQDVPAFIARVQEVLVGLVAAAFWREHKDRVLAYLDPQAVANLALADAARKVREELLDPKKDEDRGRR